MSLPTKCAPMRRLTPLVIVSVLLLGVVSASAATTTTATPAPTWKSVFSDEFTSGYSTATWTRYNGVPRCCAATRWDPSHLVVSQGIMNLQNYRDSAFGGKWVSGGLSMGKSLDQTYGKWSVRFRMDRAMGVGMCFALWPKTGLAARDRFCRGVGQVRRPHRGDRDAALRLGQLADPFQGDGRLHPVAHRQRRVDARQDRAI